MARGINKVILVGNLGNDPDVKYTQGGMAITKVSLATSSVRKDKDGNQQEKTEWHKIVLWGYELWWAVTDKYVGKVIHVNKGHALSLQYHNRKDETIFVWSGTVSYTHLTLPTSDLV